MTKKNEKVFVLLHLNMALMPVDRGALFEDPLQDALQKYNVGEVTGGGTLLNFKGMPTSCDIEFSIFAEKLENFIGFLHEVNDTFGKGSYIEVNNRKEEIGILEGLALVIDTTCLDKKTYEENVNVMLKDLDEALKKFGSYHSYYYGEEATYFYFYGTSYKKMKKVIEKTMSTYPWCKSVKL